MGTDEEPAFVPSLVGDKICGMALTSAVTAALLHRERTGQGQMVEVPMLETLAVVQHRDVRWPRLSCRRLGRRVISA